MSVTLSAPGKLFLAGEYAVLWRREGPSSETGVARVLASGPRAHAVVRPRSDRRVEVHLAGGRLAGDTTPLGVRWERPVPPGFRFVATAIDVALRVLGRETPGFAVAFESSPLVGGQKLGLGSSARATVLASEAARVGLRADFDALKVALLAHADAQGGRGSGGDVAASFAGGLLRYRRYPVEPLLEASRAERLRAALPQSPPVDLQRLPPPALPVAWVFSGASASTTQLIGEAERRWDDGARARFVVDSDALGDGLERALSRGDFAGARGAVLGLQALLTSLLGAPPEALDRVLRLAQSHGCAAKQSGAGGGDGCVVIGPDEGAIDALLRACEGRGLFGFRVTPEPGLRGEAVAHAELNGWLGQSPDER